MQKTTKPRKRNWLGGKERGGSTKGPGVIESLAQVLLLKLHIQKFKSQLFPGFCLFCFVLFSVLVFVIFLALF